MSRFSTHVYRLSALCCVRIALLICTNDCNGAFGTTITKIRNLYKGEVDESKSGRITAQLMAQPEGGLSLPRSLSLSVLLYALVLLMWV